MENHEYPPPPLSSPRNESVVSRDQELSPRYPCMCPSKGGVHPRAFRSSICSLAFLLLAESSDSFRSIWSTRPWISAARLSAVATFGVIHASSRAYCSLFCFYFVLRENIFPRWEGGERQRLNMTFNIALVSFLRVLFSQLPHSKRGHVVSYVYLMGYL